MFPYLKSACITSDNEKHRIIKPVYHKIITKLARLLGNQLFNISYTENYPPKLNRETRDVNALSISFSLVKAKLKITKFIVTNHEISFNIC